jgi:hypothetical protein
VGVVYRQGSQACLTRLAGLSDEDDIILLIC